MNEHLKICGNCEWWRSESYANSMSGLYVNSPQAWVRSPFATCFLFKMPHRLHYDLVDGKRVKLG